MTQGNHYIQTEITSSTPQSSSTFEMATPNPEPQQPIEGTTGKDDGSILHIPPPTTNHGGITPEQQVVIDTIKEGDLVLLLPSKPQRKQVFLVTKIDPDGTIHVWEPEFSFDAEPATWTISGKDCYYTPFSDTAHYPSPSEAEELRIKIARENWLTAEEMACRVSRQTLQPLHEGEVIHVNPTGLEAMKLYWGRCPYGNCSNHMFCPGCGGVSATFPDLFMSCGTLLSCPTCMGYEFAYEDKMVLQQLEYETMDSDVEREVVKERCDRIDARRAELGFKKVDWVD